MDRVPTLALALTITTAATLGGLLIYGPANAQIKNDADYIDDRSGPAQLIRSFYSAINRHEYARAWDYFGETKPVADFASFAKGYEETVFVEVETGGISEEGAAGSLYYTLPVAIRAQQQDGSEKIFAGCYTLRQISPQTQEPPFKPLHIEKGELKLTDSAFTKALPMSCGDNGVFAPNDALLEKAKAAFIASYSERCNASSSESDTTSPVDYTISYRTRDNDHQQQARLFRFLCSSGAYNQTFVFFMSDEQGLVRQVHLAEPELDIHYENDDPEKKPDAVNIIGYRSTDELTNATYDEENFSITTHAKWRGVGDAFSRGTWLFRNGAFSLVFYEVDASYDGQINPQTILDYNSAP
ncbi:DUF1176 domain-containing protein [Aquamicrobium segne]|uniref:DUF1176 domain-containing protein n=1 Tax=Aquamicrobium segne TaxID=469547 RepID=A0ABW0GXH5_9HYPH